MNEIWKEIKGCKGFYEISNLGNVRSVERTITLKNNFKRKLKSKQLKTSIRGTGYLGICVKINNVYLNFRIHRLIAEAFIPNPENKLTVNHIDGNKLNNNISNLEWNTYSENIKHAYNKKLNSCKSQYKSVSQYSKTGKFIRNYKSISEAKKKLNINGTHISDVCSGRMKSAYGFIWKFN